MNVFDSYCSEWPCKCFRRAKLKIIWDRLWSDALDLQITEVIAVQPIAIQCIQCLFCFCSQLSQKIHTSFNFFSIFSGIFDGEDTELTGHLSRITARLYLLLQFCDLSNRNVFAVRSHSCAVCYCHVSVNPSVGWFIRWLCWLVARWPPTIKLERAPSVQPFTHSIGLWQTDRRTDTYIA